MESLTMNGDARGGEGERGAALIATLLVSTMLLTLGTTLLLATSASNTTVISSTSEIEAYYAAETGLQAALNTIRGNVAPDSSLPAGTKMSLRNAVDPAISNHSGDPFAGARLSGWLSYTYPSSTLTAETAPTSSNRAPITAGYGSHLGVAYSLALIDPDDPSGSIRAANPNYNPTRVIVSSTGYGPNGAIKRMRMMINKSPFDFTPPATILIRNGSSGAEFDIGSSNAKDYTGHDNAGLATTVPAFGFTSADDKNAGDAVIDDKKPETVEDPQTGLINTSDLASWLQTSDRTNDLVTRMRLLAISQGRYFNSSTGFPEGSEAGTSTTPKLTFYDGSVEIGPGLAGTGLLIVTGTLTMKGNCEFYGLILVLGEGELIRNGGGNGATLGAIVVAKYDSTGFLAPTFDTSGGGTSDIKYDSEWVRRALTTPGPVVLGVSEH